MIDNPLENQTLKTLDSLYVNEKFEEHCSDRARELAKDNNLNPDYYDAFIEFYTEQCRESDRGYFFNDDKYIIDLWWDHNKDLYETKTPYLEIMKECFCSEGDSSDGHYHCIKCDCILTQYEDTTCCWCLERIEKEKTKN